MRIYIIFLEQIVQFYKRHKENVYRGYKNEKY